MARYRKKPVEVEAFRLTRRNNGGDPFPEWFEQAISCNEITTHGMGKFGEGPAYCEFNTVHGEKAVAREGDWIAKDAKPGTFYPIKPEVFETNYDKVY